MQLKPNIGSCLCIWRCIEKWVGLLKTMTDLVQLWASILNECLCGASAVIWSPPVKHNSHRAVCGFWIQNISTLGCMAQWWPTKNGSEIISEYNWMPHNSLKKYQNIIKGNKFTEQISEYICYREIAPIQIQIIFEGHFFFKYLNIQNHHWL